MDKNLRTPTTENQIETERPNVPKTNCSLTGHIGNSMNGGHNRTIAYKYVMAGERHYQANLKLNIQLLTPKSPAFQRLKITFKTYFVPNDRVMDDYELFLAQRGGTTESKIQELPNFGGKVIPPVQQTEDIASKIVLFNQTTKWRNNFISSYIPRMTTLEFFDQGGIGIYGTMPKYSALPLRGRIAIYNDMERNKEYDAEMPEYKENTVSEEEWNYYLGYNDINDEQSDFYQMRAKRENSYYTDYRTEAQGFYETPPVQIEPTNNFVEWASWESKIAESRAQANNAQKNTWDIIAEIRGSQKALQGKVQLIGQKTVELNYTAITQTAYNSNDSIQEKYQIMGQQGAYSYTNVDIPIYAAQEFIQDGYIHVIATVTADTVFEKGFNRIEMNVAALDQYRPDLKDDKLDVLYTAEYGGQDDNTLSFTDPIGFKRRFNEYFKIGDVIAGDMTSDGYYETKLGANNVLLYDTYLESNGTYQFYEESGFFYKQQDTYYAKKIWKDYTDLMINKNQAIMNEIANAPLNLQPYLKGNHQIFFSGLWNIQAELPIDEAVKNSYENWGEH